MPDPVIKDCNNNIKEEKMEGNEEKGEKSRGDDEKRETARDKRTSCIIIVMS